MRFIEAFFLREWQRRSAWQILLRPLAAVFELAVRLRRWRFLTSAHEQHRLPRPVIVVGNITVGGTGKTPLVVALATYLRSRGHLGVIITRGSGGHEGTAVQRIGAADINNALGDEARMLAQRTQQPVYASIDRVAAGVHAIRENPNTTIVLSDDGLQHYRLARDIEIAVVDGIRGVGNGLLLPAGPMREPIERLSDVDCIVVNMTASATSLGASAPPPRDWLAGIQVFTNSPPPVFEMRYGNERFVSVRSQAERSVAQIADESSRRHVVAVAGIGFPARFFAHLASLGVRLRATHAFADHHAFQPSDFRDIGADLILMTEKDAVKCKAFADERFVEMRVDAILQEAFYQLIESRLAALDANGH